MFLLGLNRLIVWRKKKLVLTPNSEMVRAITFQKINANPSFVVWNLLVKFIQINQLILKLSHKYQVSTDDGDAIVILSYDRNIFCGLIKVLNCADYNLIPKNRLGNMLAINHGVSSRPGIEPGQLKGVLYHELSGLIFIYYNSHSTVYHSLI